MTLPPQPSAGLPIAPNRLWFYALSWVIALLLAATALVGGLYPAVVYPTEALRRDLGSLDLVNAGLALPILLACLWLVHRGSLLGLLCWPGALFFVLYSSLIYVFALPPNVGFLMHLGLVTLCVYTVIGLIASIDQAAVRRKLSGAVPVRIIGAALAGQGLLMVVWISGSIVGTLTGRLLVAEATLANHFTDVLITPAWIMGGLLIWRRHALGYATALALLLHGSLFIIAALVLLVLRFPLSAAPTALVNLGVYLAGGLVCFVPFALYARGVTRRPTLPARVTGRAH